MTGLCAHLSWNPTAAAPALAAYAGVAGSLTLTVIVIFVGHGDLAETRIGALLLFTVALFTLGAACVMFAAFSGEQNCMRSYAEVITCGPPLSTGTVLILTGVAWMFDVYEGDTDLERVSRLMVYAAMTVALCLHAILVWTFFADLASVHAWRRPVPSASDVLAAIAVCVAIVLIAGFYRSYEQARRTSALRRAAYTVIMLSMAQFGIVAFVHMLPARQWTPPLQPWLVYTAASSSLITPLATCVAIVRCLPRFTQPRGGGGGLRPSGLAR
jgi:hypothetical protein